MKRTRESLIKELLGLCDWPEEMITQIVDHGLSSGMKLLSIELVIREEIRKDGFDVPHKMYSIEDALEAYPEFTQEDFERFIIQSGGKPEGVLQ